MCIEVADLGNITNRMPCGSVEFFYGIQDIPYHETSIKEEPKTVFFLFVILAISYHSRKGTRNGHSVFRFFSFSRVQLYPK